MIVQLFLYGGAERARTSAPITRPKSLANFPLHQLGYCSIILYKNGGEGGIRTHGRLQTYANFQDWCHKPTRPPLRIAVTVSCNSINNTTFKVNMSIEFFRILYIVIFYYDYSIISPFYLLFLSLTQFLLKIKKSIYFRFSKIYRFIYFYVQFYCFKINVYLLQYQ